MKKAVFIYLLLGFLAKSSAQITFQMVYGGQDYDDARAVLQTSDGGYMLAGRTQSYGVDTGDMYLLKIDRNGTVVWSKTYGGPRADFCSDICQTSDSGFILCGYTKSFGASEVEYLVKTDMNGDTIWTRTLGNLCDAICIKEWPGGGFLISGVTTFNTLLAKVTSTGNLQWMYQYGPSGITGVGEFVVLPGKGYMVGGYTNGFGALDRDFYLMSVDSMGNVLWSKRYESRGEDVLYSIIKTYDYGYLLAGRKIEDGTGRFLGYVIKTDSSGQFMWARTIAWNDINELHKAAELNDSLYLLAGFTQDPSNGMQLIGLFGLDHSGSVPFCKAFATSTDYGMDMQTTSDGGVIIGGFGVNLGLGSADFHLIKTDQYFNSGCVEQSFTATVDSPAVQMHPDFIPHSNYPGNIGFTNTQVSTGSQEIPICLYDHLQSPPEEPIKIFPNPAASEINFSLPEDAAEEPIMIKILNVVGQEMSPVYFRAGRSVTLNIYGLKTGIYTLEVIRAQKQFHATFIKR